MPPLRWAVAKGAMMRLTDPRRRLSEESFRRTAQRWPYALARGVAAGLLGVVVALLPGGAPEGTDGGSPGDGSPGGSFADGSLTDGSMTGGSLTDGALADGSVAAAALVALGVLAALDAGLTLVEAWRERGWPGAGARALRGVLALAAAVVLLLPGAEPAERLAPAGLLILAAGLVVGGRSYLQRDLLPGVWGFGAGAGAGAVLAGLAALVAPETVVGSARASVVALAAGLAVLEVSRALVLRRGLRPAQTPSTRSTLTGSSA